MKNTDNSSNLLSRPFPLLTLPPEIRTQIYTYCLCAPNQGLRFYDPQCRLRAHRAPTTALLSANKQLHAEASAVLYSKNEFLFLEPRGLLNFARKIGPRNSKLVRQIRIRIHFYEDEDIVMWSRGRKPKGLLWERPPSRREVESSWPRGLRI
ncbi:uncharacterized protein BDR25DRAFT_32993 [Lindgomyces ingoldianus]|uniref:Uncharacterized protein n=1 Tax=Lindgomyces ingoldianus TaxID=673940 RepID=A0ACB6QVF7_9PLEO|nr:uncharacterized protein BDR25DRAFT_32993 [Lindgomyces ingoldianus]KAF2470262.1 hypothetical protein BDR25DRAFT_32993 [Lindgomyces ingoldianus]